MSHNINKDKVDLIWGLSASQEYDDLNKIPYVQIYLTKSGLTANVIRINGNLSSLFGWPCVNNEKGDVIALL